MAQNSPSHLTMKSLAAALVKYLLVERQNKTNFEKSLKNLKKLTEAEF